MPDEVYCESVQKIYSFPEWVMTPCQEVPNLASLCHCCLNNGDTLNSFLQKHTEVGEVLNDLIKQAKYKCEALRHS